MSDETRSAYACFPGYRVDLQVQPGVVRARCRGVVIAESAHALRVQETKHEPQLYFPRQDVRMAYLQRTSRSTYCPFKGRASYWHVLVGSGRSEHAAWSYEAPMDEVRGLGSYVAYYGILAGDCVEVRIDEA